MTTKGEILEQALALVSAIEAWEGEESPPVPPVLTKTYTVKPGDKALGHFVDGYDKVGKPIMLIWPKKGTEGRHRYDDGEKIQVLPDGVLASGAIRFYEIAQSPEPGVRLYLSEMDGTLS